jgi:hypothetical protein
MTGSLGRTGGGTAVWFTIGAGARGRIRVQGPAFDGRARSLEGEMSALWSRYQELGCLTTSSHSPWTASRIENEVVFRPVLRSDLPARIAVAWFWIVLAGLTGGPWPLVFLVFAVFTFIVRRYTPAPGYYFRLCLDDGGIRYPAPAAVEAKRVEVPAFGHRNPPGEQVIPLDSDSLVLVEERQEHLATFHVISLVDTHPRAHPLFTLATRGEAHRCAVWLATILDCPAVRATTLQAPYRSFYWPEEYLPSLIAEGRLLYSPQKNGSETIPPSPPNGNPAEAPLPGAGHGVRAERIRTGWLRRSIRLSGAVTGVITYDGRNLGTLGSPEAIYIDDREVKDLVDHDSTPSNRHLEFASPAAGGTTRIEIEVRLTSAVLFHIDELWLSIGGRLVYHERGGRPVELGINALPLPGGAPRPEATALPTPAAGAAPEGASLPRPRQ